MRYREHPVPDTLRRRIECVWTLRDDAPGDAVQTIWPDGRCELIAHFAAPMRRHRGDGRSEDQAPLLFAAQQRRPIRLQARGPVHCLGVRLAPAASALIAGPALAALRDEIADLHALDAGFAAMFAEAARAFAEDSTALWTSLERRCSAATFDAIVEAAAQALDDAHGDARIPALAAESGISLRGLQTRFLAAVGSTPKEYARVRRLRALLQALDDDTLPLAQLAANHGYADQAHATHELRQFTGSTPARLLRALRDNRNGENAVRLAAAFVRGRGA
jgi:methylphosphotriester-DNA--protein-cysteine methyltransferase